MATKKITLNELRSIVKQIIKEETHLNYNNKTELEREGYIMSNIEFGHRGFIVTMETKTPYHRVEVQLVNKGEGGYEYDKNDDEIIAINKQTFINTVSSASWVDDYVTDSDVKMYAERIAHWLSKKWNVPLI